MYAIESNVRFPKTKKAKRESAKVRKVYNAYAEAYKLVYGVMPTGFTYDDKTQFICVGNSGGFSLKRLAEMTRMLLARVG